MDSKSVKLTTGKRSFSSMRRIKNWLETSTVQSSLIDFSVINIEKDLSTKINEDRIMINFSTYVSKTYIINIIFK